MAEIPRSTKIAKVHVDGGGGGVNLMAGHGSPVCLSVLPDALPLQYEQTHRVNSRPRSSPRSLKGRLIQRLLDIFSSMQFHYLLLPRAFVIMQCTTQCSPTWRGTCIYNTLKPESDHLNMNKLMSSLKRHTE